MSPEAAQAGHAATGFPRVSGDEPVMDDVLPISE